MPFSIPPIIQLADLYPNLSAIIIDDVLNLVIQRQIGHCIQITDLPVEIMNDVCRTLYNNQNKFEAYVLNSHPSENWHITSTKLIERRNAEDSVIVVFLPPDLRTSAEDSFDITTFERFVVKDLFRRLRDHLLSQFNEDDKQIIQLVIRESGCRDKAAICTYLYALLHIDNSEAAGLAIFHLGLVPDAALLEDAKLIRPRISRNVKSVDILSSPDRPLLSKLQSQELGLTPESINSLYQFFSQIEASNTSHWLRRILEPKFVDNLTFDKWSFREKISGQVDEIVITNLGTEKHTPDGYPLVDIQHTKKLKIAWETTPTPLQCTNLAYFTVELLQNDVPATDAKKVNIGKSQSSSRSTILSNLDKLDLEDGFYYIRVNALGQGGLLLNSTESDSFFIKGGLDVEEDDDWTTSTRNTQYQVVNSIYEAMLRAQFSLRSRSKSLFDIKQADVSWITPDRRGGKRYSDHFNIKYGSNEQYSIPVNAILKRIQIETLTDPDLLGRWEIDLTQPITPNDDAELRTVTGISYEHLENFLLARKSLFQKIHYPEQYKDISSTVETTDLIQYADDIVSYAKTYLDVLININAKARVLQNDRNSSEFQSLLEENHQILSIDNVLLKLPGEHIAFLVAPTHPLKMLWSLQFSRLTHYWLKRFETASKGEISLHAIISLLSHLSTLNLPYFISGASGELLNNVDNFDIFWSIFLPDTVVDKRAVISQIKEALGSPELDERFTTITGPDLALKVQRYISQHPYVSSLRINLIQPGSASIIVDMLLALEKKRSDIHYQIHLFSSDYQRDMLGSALDELMSPSERKSGSEELDAFHTASANGLFPKLTYSKHNLQSLIDDPENYEAHISFLFDVFKVEFEVTKPIAKRSNYLYGLLSEYVEVFSTDNGDIRWLRQIVAHEGEEIADNLPDIHPLLVQLQNTYSQVTSGFYSGDFLAGMVPAISLPLTPFDKNLINQVHQSSDWVFTIDRNFGLEYLDNPYDDYCPAYLIDFQPDYFSKSGHKLIISTQQMSEIERIITPIVNDLDLLKHSEVVQHILDALRSISGRLVLKLLSSPQMARGALGMALAQIFMKKSGLLRDLILLPLDAHEHLFTTARTDLALLGQEISLKRTDMLLIDVQPNSNSLGFHLVEVKLRTTPGALNDATLKQDIFQQLDNSQKALQVLFDPHYSETDRLDRPILSKELATLLSFYLERSVRYRLIGSELSQRIQTAINRLEAGYSLNFSRSGLILGFGDLDYHIENDQDINYHLIGRNSILEMLSSDKMLDQTTFSDTRSAFKQQTENQFDDLNLPSAIPLDLSVVKPEDEGIKENNVESPIAPIQSEEVIPFDILLGAKHPTPQYGIIGKVAGGKSVALDLNGTNSICLFGVQGSGKSYTLGSILEMAVMPIAGINKLPNPLASVVFHYSKTEDYRPEFTTMVFPNVGSEVDDLESEYGAFPAGVSDLLLLVPQGKLEKRRQEFPNYSVQPIAFNSTELDIEDWKFLMGVVGSDALYVKRINHILRQHRNNLRLEILLKAINESDLTELQISLANNRLQIAKEYINDSESLARYVVPGRLIIVDLRDELIEKDEALGLFMVLLKIFSNAKYKERLFNKLMVFDEAHKYMSTGFIDEVVSIVREMRHKGTTVLIASQDPPSVPLPLIELSSQIILHRFSSPSWLKHINRATIALKDLTVSRLNMLSKGQAYVWSREATLGEFETRAVKVTIRPRVTRHGGGTVTATDE